MKTVFKLESDQDCRNLYEFLKAHWPARAREKHPLVVTVEPAGAKRSNRQNARYHAILQHIEAWAWVEGEQYPSEVWHEMFKRKFVGILDLPGGGMAGQSSSDLTTMEFQTFMDKVEAYAASELGVSFPG